MTQRKKDKNGVFKTYPHVDGERVSRDLAFDYPDQFFWIYNYSIKRDGKWKTQSKSVPRKKLWSVRSAIAEGKPVSYVLDLIRS
ncbi:MAG: hypothetical protein F6K45_23115 [Kamptonema sp. SIO1D9]|nr:hypothetical protein [Kamptonema sp. SIO1D9]